MYRCKKCKRKVKDWMFTPVQFYLKNKWAEDHDPEAIKAGHKRWLTQHHPELVECGRCDRMVEWET